jgi:hypothetical protein
MADPKENPHFNEKTTRKRPSLCKRVQMHTMHTSHYQTSDTSAAAAEHYCPGPDTDLVVAVLFDYFCGRRGDHEAEGNLVEERHG